jgi:SAM-dependent methyltransferase
MDWTQKFFDRTWLEHGFDLVSKEETKQEAEFIFQALNLKRNEELLDIGCGIGRHSVALANKGLRVTGLDFNADYIKRAKSLALATRIRPTFVEGDMRKLPYVNKFDAAVCFWSSFGFFDDDVNFAILKNIHKALKNGGRFLLDVTNRDFLIRYYQQKSWTKTGRGYVLEKRLINVETSRIATTWHFIGGGSPVRKKSDIRLYSLHELESILARAGFKANARYGDINRARPNLNTPRLIICSTALPRGR